MMETTDRERYPILETASELANGNIKISSGKPNEWLISDRAVDSLEEL